MDILAGNLGANNKLRPTPEEPLRMYVNDFDDNEQPEQALTYFVGDRRIPFASHAELIKQLPGLKKRYLFAQDMAAASIEDIFSDEKLASARVYEVNTLESVAFFNDRSGGYTVRALSGRSQFSSINASIELTGGRYTEGAPARPATTWLVGGNFLRSNIEMGWYDASYAHVLAFRPDGASESYPLPGLRLGGVIQSIQPITIAGKAAFLVARNDDTLRVIRASGGPEH